MNEIYFDNAATTRMAPEVLETILPYLTDSYENPSSMYGFARRTASAIDKARICIADFIGAEDYEIYFTSGGSEADNWAIKAIAEVHSTNGKHIITSKIEHHAILRTCEWLEHKGYDITYLDVDSKGLISPNSLKQALRPDTILVSIMLANNEIGTIEPISILSQISHESGAIFHTDAVQALGHIPVNVSELGIDMLSASGHKFNGPKGVGILYIRKGIEIHSYIHGGSQERGRRAGTLNVPGIIGMAKASELAKINMKKHADYEKDLRDYFISSVLNRIPDCQLNGDKDKRLPNNINICFKNTDAETVLIMLDQLGICASAGSACTSGSLEASHVLLAIGLTKKDAKSSVRFTISQESTKEEIDYTVDKLYEIIARLRSML